MTQLFDYITYYGGSGVGNYNYLSGLIYNTSLKFNINAQDIPVFRGANIRNIFSFSKWSFNVSGIGIDDTDFFLTIKSIPSGLDSESLLQINKSGVIYINGAYSGQPSGELTYSSGNNGTLSINIEPEVTKDIPEGLYYWDVKNTGTNRQIRSYGTIKVELPVTRKFN